LDRAVRAPFVSRRGLHREWQKAEYFGGHEVKFAGCAKLSAPGGKRVVRGGGHYGVEVHIMGRRCTLWRFATFSGLK
jgi:hypothetical protein